MNVRRSLLLVALCLIAQYPIHGQIALGGPDLAANQPLARGASVHAIAESDSLPENPLPVEAGLPSQAPPSSVIYPVRNEIPESLASVTGMDQGFLPCNCPAPFKQGGQTLRFTFTTYDRDGRPTPDAPRIAGASNSVIGYAYWDPHRLYSPLVSPLVQGIKFGHQEVGEIFAGNLFEGFASNVKHALHLGSSSSDR